VIHNNKPIFIFCKFEELLRRFLFISGAHAAALFITLKTNITRHFYSLHSAYICWLLLSLIFMATVAGAKSEKNYIYGLFDSKFLTEGFRQDLRKGIVLAIDEEKSTEKNHEIIFDYGGDEFSSHVHKQHLSSVAAIGVGEADGFADMDLGLYGLFEAETKIESGDFFNLVLSLEYKQPSWERVISNIYKANKIVLLIEDMEFADKNLARIEKELKNAGISLVTYMIPSSNNLAIKSAVMQLRKHEFDLILVINEFNKSMKFINMAERLGVNAPILFLSLDVSKADKNWFYFPSPYDKRAKIGQQYLKAIDQLSGINKGLVSNFDTKLQPGIGSYIGYIWTKAVIEMSKKVDGKLNSKSIINAAKKYRSIAYGDLTVYFENHIEHNSKFKKVLLQEFK
jgi:hypothetical protein